MKINELFPYSAQISFYITITLIPLFSLLLIIFNLFLKNSTELINFLFTAFPSNIANLLKSLLSQINVSVGFNIFTIIILLLSSTKVMDNVIRVLDLIHKTKSKKTYIQSKLKSVYLILLLISGLLSSFILLFFRNAFFQYLGFKNEILFNITNYFFSIALIMLCVSLVYYLAPEKKVKYSNVIKGGVFFTLSWMVLANLFTLFSSLLFTSVVGSVNILFAILIFIYLIVILFLIGAIISYESDN